MSSCAPLSVSNLILETIQKQSIRHTQKAAAAVCVTMIDAFLMDIHHCLISEELRLAHPKTVLGRKLKYCLYGRFLDTVMGFIRRVWVSKLKQIFHEYLSVHHVQASVFITQRQTAAIIL